MIQKLSDAESCLSSLILLIVFAKYLKVDPI